MCQQLDAATFVKYVTKAVLYKSMACRVAYWLFDTDMFLIFRHHVNAAQNLTFLSTLSESGIIQNIDAVLSVHVKISYLWNSKPHSSLTISCSCTVSDTIILLLAACTILRTCPSPRVHSSRVIWSFCHIIEELSLYSQGVWACHSVTITLCPSPSNFCMERAVEMS